MSKNTKAAFIKWRGEKNGQFRTATLRGGAGGGGTLLQTVNYWPNSSASKDAAYAIFIEVAAREGYVIVGSDRNEEQGA